MIPVDKQPYKVGEVGSRLSMLDAYRQDLDFWGNGERKIYHPLTQSLSKFLVKNVSCVRDSAMHFWCDVGCGAGFFLEGLCESMRAEGRVVLPSGVDVSPEALDRCRQLYPHGEFVEIDLDTYLHKEGHTVVPWINANVVSFIDTLQYFKNYRRTLAEIIAGVQVGTVIVVADGMIRSNLRDWLKNVDEVAYIGGWIDYSTPVTPRDPNNPKSKSSHLKYRIYQKLL